jgi:hypothetical protein
MYREGKAINPVMNTPARRAEYTRVFETSLGNSGY